MFLSIRHKSFVSLQSTAHRIEPHTASRAHGTRQKAGIGKGRSRGGRGRSDTQEGEMARQRCLSRQVARGVLLGVATRGSDHAVASGEKKASDQGVATRGGDHAFALFLPQLFVFDLIRRQAKALHRCTDFCFLFRVNGALNRTLPYLHLMRAYPQTWQAM